jgi:hypothetical protein
MGLKDDLEAEMATMFALNGQSVMEKQFLKQKI